MYKVLKKIQWCFSLIFMLAGLRTFSAGEFPMGLFMMALGLLAFPPFLKLLEQRGRKPSMPTRIIAGALLFILAVAFMPVETPAVTPAGQVLSSDSGYRTVVKVTPEPTSALEQKEVAISSVEALLSDNSVDKQTPNTPLFPAENEGVAAGDVLEVHFIDVGQGDSILIEAGSDSMLIDAGENNMGDLVVDYLEEQGIEKLSYLVCSHGHSDHAGGADDVIKNFDINKIIMPDVVHTTRTFEDVLDAIDEKGYKITPAVVGDEYSLGDAHFTILAPVGSSYEDLNNYSVVIRLEYGNTSFLFTGDAEELSERDMLGTGMDLSADVLKASHHGSGYSCGDTFIDAVGANDVVISVGAGNEYGHPHPETVNKFMDRGMNVYRTDESGSILAISDGSEVEFNCEPSAERLVPTSAPTPTVTPEPFEEPQTKDDRKEIVVYVTETGSKYHSAGCQYLRKSKLPIILDDARDMYGPCSRCSPPR